MSTEINQDLTIYQRGMGGKFADFENMEENRLRLIIAHSAQALKHFFETGVYGDDENSNPDTLPRFWPYVRYLVYDAIKPTLGDGDSQFAHQRYSNKFLEDIAKEALAIADELPENMTQQEWKFFVEVSTYMMMADPFFIEQGLVTKKGQDGFENQSLLAGLGLISGDDMYHIQFTHWKKSFGIGPRNE